MAENIICAMLEYWSILLFVRIALQLPLDKPKRYVVIYSTISIAVLSICSEFIARFEIWMGILLLEVISVFLLFRGRWQERLFAFYLSYMSFSTISGWIAGIVALSYNMDALTKQSVILQMVICSIFGGIIFLYDKYRNPSQKFEKYKREWCTLSVFLVATVTCIASHLGVTMMLGKYYDERGTFWKMMVLLTMITEFIFILIAFFLWLSQQKKNQLQWDNYQREQYICLREQQYRFFEQNEKAVRTMEHDMDKHLDCIHTLLKKGCVQEANQYIEKIIQVKNHTIPRIFKSGNLFVDILLTELQEQIADEMVSIEVKGEFPQEINMEAYDITTLFGNLFHNAAEAVKQMPKEVERYVHISFYEEGRYFMCIIDNTYEQELKQDSRGNYLTTKKNNDRKHGYGVLNAKRIVEQYNGKIWFNAEEGHFKVDIMLPVIKE